MPRTKEKPSFDTHFRKGEKVVATVDLPGVPEGTKGTVKLVNGMSWTRYWIFFDNGVDLGSIDHNVLVRAKHWEDFQLHRANAGSVAAAGATAAAAASSDGEAAAPAAGGSRIPEHLLERTKNRKKALGIG